MKSINWVISLCQNTRVGKSMKKVYGKGVSNSVESTTYPIDILLINNIYKQLTVFMYITKIGSLLL